jgi:hypothetical protein
MPGRAGSRKGAEPGPPGRSRYSSRINPDQGPRAPISPDDQLHDRFERAIVNAQAEDRPLRGGESTLATAIEKIRLGGHGRKRGELAAAGARALKARSRRG